MVYSFYKSMLGLIKCFLCIDMKNQADNGTDKCNDTTDQKQIETSTILNHRTEIVIGKFAFCAHSFINCKNSLNQGQDNIQCIYPQHRQCNDHDCSDQKDDAIVAVLK